jgi:hypothetical protein
MRHRCVYMNKNTVCISLKKYIVSYDSNFIQALFRLCGSPLVLLGSYSCIHLCCLFGFILVCCAWSFYVSFYMCMHTVPLCSTAALLQIVCKMTVTPACQDFQQHGVLCSVGAAVSRGERPPHTPRWDRRKSLLT